MALSERSESKGNFPSSIHSSVPAPHFPRLDILINPHSRQRKAKGGFMLWKVYMLRLPRNCIYVGCTNDLERRLSEHRGGTGSRITSEALSLELIHTESFPDLSSARKREGQLKGWKKLGKKLGDRPVVATSRIEGRTSSEEAATPAGFMAWKNYPKTGRHRITPPIFPTRGAEPGDKS